jgi:hypothetical protein
MLSTFAPLFAGMMGTEALEYEDDGCLCEGSNAVWDEASVKRPGILLFPEWAGVGE